MIDSVVRKILKEEFYSKMSLNENVKVSDKLRYHLTNKIFTTIDNKCIDLLAELLDNELSNDKFNIKDY